MTHEEKENDDMVNIIDQFGGKRRNNSNPRTEPPLPSVVRGGQPKTLNPDVVAAMQSYSEAIERAERLQRELDHERNARSEEVNHLKADLELERRHVHEMKNTLDGERRRAEYYHTYAVEVRTHLADLVTKAMKANDVALKLAEDRLDRIKNDAGPKLMSRADEEDALKAVEDRLLPPHLDPEDPKPAA